MCLRESKWRLIFPVSVGGQFYIVYHVSPNGVTRTPFQGHEDSMNSQASEHESIQILYIYIYDYNYDYIQSMHNGPTSAYLDSFNNPN